MATDTENKITIMVLFMVSCRLGQFTFFVSSCTSFKKRRSFSAMCTIYKYILSKKASGPSGVKGISNLPRCQDSLPTWRMSG